MKRGNAKLLTSLLAFGTIACAGTPDHPPFALSHPDHPDGWRRVDLEIDEDPLVQWRLVLPNAMHVPRDSGLRAETYKTLLEQDYTLESFYRESLAHERETCPRSRAQLLDQGATRLVYEATAPIDSRCWSYQLVRLELGKDAIHALAVYAHRPLDEADRRFWLEIVQNAIFDP